MKGSMSVKVMVMVDCKGSLESQKVDPVQSNDRGALRRRMTSYAAMSVYDVEIEIIEWKPTEEEE